MPVISWLSSYFYPFIFNPTPMACQLSGDHHPWTTASSHYTTYKCLVLWYKSKYKIGKFFLKVHSYLFFMTWSLHEIILQSLHSCLVFNELSLFWFPKAIHTYVNMRLWQDGKQRNEARYKTLINLLMWK